MVPSFVLAVGILTLQAVFTHYVSYSRLKDIKQMGFPILVVGSAADLMIRASNSYLLRDALEPAEFIDLKDSGHGVHVECAQDFHDAIVRNFHRAT
jgi:pimeloyl-ACP methyl ester carboxylesterase